MPNYQIRNVVTNKVLTETCNTDAFDHQVERAQHFAKKIGQPFAVFGQPFFPDENAKSGFAIGEAFSSELYVAQP